MVNALHGQT